ncbi:unnamed protein product [Discula destructiva]
MEAGSLPLGQQTTNPAPAEDPNQPLSDDEDLIDTTAPNEEPQLPGAFISGPFVTSRTASRANRFARQAQTLSANLEEEPYDPDEQNIPNMRVPRPAP